MIIRTKEELLDYKISDFSETSSSIAGTSMKLHSAISACIFIYNQVTDLGGKPKDYIAEASRVFNVPEGIITWLL